MDKNQEPKTTGGKMDKVTICALTCGRPEYTDSTWKHNLSNAGCDFDMFWFDNGSNEEDLISIFTTSLSYRISWFKGVVENVGIAAALNEMIHLAFSRGADYVFTMANDIIEPADFLIKRIEAAKDIENTGVVAVLVEGAARYRQQYLNGHLIEPGTKSRQVIGNWLITREAYEKVGVFYTGFGIYGPLDLEYCDRLYQAGLKYYYLSSLRADHIGVDNPKEYQSKKMKSLADSRSKYHKRQSDIFNNKISPFFM